MTFAFSFGIVRRRRVGDVEGAVVGREAEAVRLHDLVGELRQPPGLRVDVVDAGRQLELADVALVVQVAAVSRDR